MKRLAICGFPVPWRYIERTGETVFELTYYQWVKPMVIEHIDGSASLRMVYAGAVHDGCDGVRFRDKFAASEAAERELLPMYQLASVSFGRDEYHHYADRYIKKQAACFPYNAC